MEGSIHFAEGGFGLCCGYTEGLILNYSVLYNGKINKGTCSATIGMPLHSTPSLIWHLRKYPCPRKNAFELFDWMQHETISTITASSLTAVTSAMSLGRFGSVRPKKVRKSVNPEKNGWVRPGVMKLPFFWGGSNEGKCVLILRDFPYTSALFGLAM